MMDDDDDDDDDDYDYDDDDADDDDDDDDGDDAPCQYIVQRGWQILIPHGDMKINFMLSPI